ncbi:MAG: outer membrane beta-barrel protein [Vibrio gallaecicus]|uniref:outer membrane beta-barrel protein n=1 Tax=Vibrio TaxID=662 RepID=UPI001869D250|nr:MULTISPECIES: outer membrane beta-barrel protein [Vibrio]MBE4593572.1 hypothetical protein [Vibrio navarrensis]MBY8292613.1 porin family protein [Vibrio fluvialis]MCR9640789.1 porin family protein [Vibrio alginolyticus]HCE2179566.1 porin family protein [Vibrio parahaemolyticus]
MKKAIVFALAIAFAASTQAASLPNFGTFTQMMGQGGFGGNFFVTGTTGFTDYKEDAITDTAAIAGVRAGYEFNPYLGVELGYIDMGSVEVDSDIEISNATKYIAVKPMLPIGFFDLYARAGVHSYDAEVKHRLGGVIEKSGTEGMYGVGADLRIKNFSVGVGYSLYMMDDLDVGNYELNATVRF